ncbi:MAG: hypothetical protein ABEK59_07745 [Halobacteria archaeon]
MLEIVIFAGVAAIYAVVFWGYWISKFGNSNEVSVGFLHDLVVAVLPFIGLYWTGDALGISVVNGLSISLGMFLFTLVLAAIYLKISGTDDKSYPKQTEEPELFGDIGAVSQKTESSNKRKREKNKVSGRSTDARGFVEDSDETDIDIKERLDID